MLANVAVGVVATLHLVFFLLESLLWRTPSGRRIFGTTVEFATATASLAANQGLYNSFLAGGLVWGLLQGRRDVEVFFLGCVIIAGVFGALTVKRTILFVQALPGAIALALLFMNR